MAAGRFDRKLRLHATYDILIAALAALSLMERLDVPDDVLELIASSIERNIRELEGALIRVTAFASLNQTSIDRSLAEIVLRDLTWSTTAAPTGSRTVTKIVGLGGGTGASRFAGADTDLNAGDECGLRAELGHVLAQLS